MLANTVLLLNSLLCPPLGFLINFLLLWLILRRTPKEMAVHSRVLLQTCLLDCLVLTVETIGQCIFVMDSKHLLFITFYDGYFIRLFQSQWASRPSMLIFIDFFWVLFNHLSTAGISVQFVYRYLRLNRNMNVKLRHFLLLLLGPAFLTTLMCFGIAMDMHNRQNVQNLDRQLFGQFIDFQKQTPFYSTFIVEKNDMAFILLYYLVTIMYIFTYLVILFCGYKMVRFVHNHATLNARMKELNRQLTKNLIILAIFPFLLDFCTTIAMGLGLGADGDGMPWMLQLQFYLFCAAHWLPVLNPLASIYVNRPYRDAVLGRFYKVTPMPMANG